MRRPSPGGLLPKCIGGVRLVLSVNLLRLSLFDTGGAAVRAPMRRADRRADKRSDEAEEDKREEDA